MTNSTLPKVRDSRQIQCYQNCVIHDKFNTKKVKKHYLYPKLQKNTEIIFKVQNICNICFLGPKNLHQNCVIHDKVIFYTTRYRVLHQNFYTSWEILHQQCWYCWYVFASLTRPSSNIVLFYCPSLITQFSARPRKRSAIFGHVLASPGQLEPSSAK